MVAEKERVISYFHSIRSPHESRPNPDLSRPHPYSLIGIAVIYLNSYPRAQSALLSGLPHVVTVVYAIP